MARQQQVQTFHKYTPYKFASYFLSLKPSNHLTMKATI